MPEIISLEEATARGLKFYFTGIPCRHGHIVNRFVKNRNCLECSRKSAREYQSKLRREHPEKVMECYRLWYERNRKRIAPIRRAQARKNCTKLRKKRNDRYRKMKIAISVLARLGIDINS